MITRTYNLHCYDDKGDIINSYDFYNDGPISATDFPSITNDSSTTYDMIHSPVNSLSNTSITFNLVCDSYESFYDFSNNVKGADKLILGYLNCVNVLTGAIQVDVLIDNITHTDINSEYGDFEFSLSLTKLGLWYTPRIAMAGSGYGDLALPNPSDYYWKNISIRPDGFYVSTYTDPYVRDVTFYDRYTSGGMEFQITSLRKNLPSNYTQGIAITMVNIGNTSRAVPKIIVETSYDPTDPFGVNQYFYVAYDQTKAIVPAGGTFYYNSFNGFEATYILDANGANRINLIELETIGSSGLIKYSNNTVKLNILVSDEWSWQCFIYVKDEQVFV